jgi:hypothetical protein
LVAETDAHERRSEEARVLAQEIGGDDYCDDDHQRGEDGHPWLVELNLAEQHPEKRGTRGADRCAHDGAQQNSPGSSPTQR